ncbi:MAG: hypothetical protein U0263_21080 [Polyangiaceae bacterium]
MENVRSLSSAVNANVTEVHNWLEAKASRGELPASTARLRSTALNQLTSVLDDDESRDPTLLLAKLEELTTRWATLNPEAKPDTARAYLSRARTALNDWFAWKADPTTFKFTRKQGAGKAATGPKAKSPPAPTKSPERDDLDFRRFPLGGGRGEFVFATTATELTVSDVRRIACHLLTCATDFDPSQRDHGEQFAMVMQSS